MAEGGSFRSVKSSNRGSSDTYFSDARSLTSTLSEASRPERPQRPSDPLEPSNLSFPNRPSSRASSVYSTNRESLQPSFPRDVHTAPALGLYPPFRTQGDFHPSQSPNPFQATLPKSDWPPPLHIHPRQDSHHRSVEMIPDKFSYNLGGSNWERKRSNDNTSASTSSYIESGKPPMPVFPSQQGHAPKNRVWVILMGIFGTLIVAIATLLFTAASFNNIQALNAGQQYKPTNDIVTVWPISAPLGENNESISASPITQISTSTTTVKGAPPAESDSESPLSTTTLYRFSERIEYLALREEAAVQSFVSEESKASSVADYIPTTTFQVPNTTRSQSTYTSTIISTIYLNVAGRRSNNPLSWRPLKRHSSFDGQDSQLIHSSEIVHKNARSEGDKAIEDVSTATITTTARQTAVPSTHGRPKIVATLIHRQPKQTYWQAYSLLRQQASMLCFAQKTYIETPSVRNQADDALAARIDSRLCTSFNTTFPMVPQGNKCDTKKEWTELVGALDQACQYEKVGTIVVQSLNILCALMATLKQDLLECTENVASATGGPVSSLPPATGLPVSSLPIASGLPASSLPSMQLVSAPRPVASSVISSNPGLTTLSTVVSSVATPNPAPTVPNQPAVTSMTPFSSLSPASVPPASTGPAPIIPASVAPTPVPASPAPASPASAPAPALAGVEPTAAPNAPVCAAAVSQLTFSKPAKWSAPVITSIPPWTAPISYQGLTTKPGMLPADPIPCGYTSSAFTLVVPATTQTGEMTFYTGQDAFVNQPACQNTPKLQHNEALAAIGWKLFDFGRGGRETGDSVFCGRKIRAWCERADGTRSEVNLWVRDRCAGCRPQDIDVLEEVFPFCASLDVGRARVGWVWAED